MQPTTRRRGASLVEYIVLVVLIAIALFGAVRLFGREVERKHNDATVEVLVMDR